MKKNDLYLDKSQSVDSRVKDLFKRMTLEEKIGQMCQHHNQKYDILVQYIRERAIGSVLQSQGEETNTLQKIAEETRLKIPLLLAVDAIHGFALIPGGTVYPSQLGMSSAWDADMLLKVGQVTAKEMAVAGLHWTFSPVLCIGRDPRWGRTDETFGEDPLLIGDLALGLIKGYQSGKMSDPTYMLACAKHFAGYSETQGGRDSSEADISRRKLMSYFLPGFERVARAGCNTFMAGYQAIDGVPCSLNRWLLKDKLKDEWGLDGIIVTDWNNVGHTITKQFVCADYEEAAIRAVEAGNDMMMSTPEFYDAAIKAAKAGKLNMERVNDSVKRILSLKFRLGLFDHRRYMDLSKAQEVRGCDEHIRHAEAVATESLVLLKNDGVLPIKKSVKKIAVIGPNADDAQAMLGDWSCLMHLYGKSPTYGHPAEKIATPLQGIRARAGKKTEVIYVRGCDVIDATIDETTKAVKAAKAADIAIVVIGDNKTICGESYDRATLELTGGQDKLVRAVQATGTPVVVVLINSKPLAINWVAENANAIVEAWNPGMRGGAAIASVLFGDVNPSGKLTISFPRTAGQLPVYYNQIPGWHTPWEGPRKEYIDLPEGPLFPFGYGLSYTRFVYSDLKVKTPVVRQGKPVKASVVVKNAGKRAGVEIAQAYINDKVSSLTTPVKVLAAYQKISLGAGESKRVEVEIPYERLSFVDADLNRIVEPGEFDLMVGSSSADGDLLKAGFRVE